MGAVAKKPRVLDVAALGKLFEALKAAGHTLIGPVASDGAIQYQPIDGVADLPAGWSDFQDKGRYRLTETGETSLFAYASAPQSWKRYLHPPRLKLFSARRDKGQIRFDDEAKPIPKYAFIGVRACDLNAIAIQDRVFIDNGQIDPHYAVRRERAFLVAVNCSRAGGTCFCTSMGTGPRAETGYDLALTELIDARGHRFLLEAGSEAGEDIAAGLDTAAAVQEDIDAAAALSERVAGNMGRSLDTNGLPEILARNLSHPHWDAVAERCLACSNCTMVCPTCFCTSVEDTTSLEDGSAERWRNWDSCFSGRFTHVVGGQVRDSTRSRYRQWLTHKLSYWHEQFDSSGCVGCGRCITWCPVGIDITEEATAIRAGDEA